MREVLIAFISAGGVLTIREAAVGVYKWVTGRQAAERSAMQTAWSERDEEAVRRRRAEETAHALRMFLIQNGVDIPDELRSDPGDR